MPTINVTIKNLPQIKAAFAKAPQTMKISLTRAIPLALKAIKDYEEKEYADLGIGVITGRLLLSIRTGLYYSTGALRGEVGPNTSAYPGYDVTAKGGHYAYYVHEGTYKMKSRPFLLNAVRDADQEVNDIFKKAVQDTLEIIARESN